MLGNYAIAANTAPFTISPRPASVTPNPAGKTYGDADPPLSGMLTGFLATDGVTAVYARTPGETVAGGPYTVFATLGPASVLGNYAIAYGLASFTIVPRPASVTPNPASKAYGDPDPPLTGTLVGFLAPDGVTAAYTRTPGETVSGSPYTIMATLLPAAAVGNYAVTYDTAPFTILGVRGLKGSLRADLKALRASVTDKKDGKELDDAMAELTEALLPRLWIDELHPTPKDGAHVFQEEKDAALELRELVKSRKSAIPDTLLLAFVDRIVRADRLLATVAIGDARGGDARKLDKASDEVQKGDRERLQGDAEGAIEHYRSAWWLALEAAS